MSEQQTTAEPIEAKRLPHSTPEANKKVVLDFIEKAINQGDFDAAAFWLEVHPA